MNSITGIAVGMRVIDIQFGWGLRDVQFALFEYQTLNEFHRSGGMSKWHVGEKKADELTLALISRALKLYNTYDFQSIEQDQELDVERIVFFYRTSLERQEVYVPHIQLGRTSKEINPEGFTCSETFTQYTIEWATTDPGWPDAVVVAEFTAEEILRRGRPFRGARLLEYGQVGN